MLPSVIERLGPKRPVHLDIGRTSLRLRHGKALHQCTLASPLSGSQARAVAVEVLQHALRELLAAIPGRLGAVVLTVSDALARSWMVERLPGLANQREIAALAEGQMIDIYGDAVDAQGQWRVRIDAEPFATHWPAVALPEDLLAAVEAVVGERGGVLTAMSTRFVARFNARRRGFRRQPAPRAYVLELADAVTVGIRDGQQWYSLRTHPPLARMATSLETIIRRDCRAAGLEPSDCQVERLGDGGRSGNELQLDFRPPKRDVSLRLGLGSAALALMMAGAWMLTGDTVAVSSLHRASLPSAEAVAAINGAVDELNFPWGKVLDTLEASVDDGFRIVRFEADAHDRRFGLHGEARSSQLVLELPGRLQRDGVVAEARVVSQGPAANDEPGGLPISFGIEASLAAGNGGQP